jgi:hypothetical protein
MGTLQSTLSELVRMQRGAQQPKSKCITRVGLMKDYQPDYPVEMYSNQGIAPERLYQSPGPSKANPSPVLYEQPSKPAQPKWEPPNENGSTAPGSDDDDEDPLNPTQMNAPFDNMLSLAEAARLKADGHMDQTNTRSPVKRPASNIPFDFGSPSHPSKKRRSTRVGAELELGLQMPYPVERGDKMHAFPDAIDLGLCTSEQGKQLVDL